MKNPAVLFYTSDFITGTLFMTNEEVGAYIRVLCMQHQKGHLTEEEIQQICKKKKIFSSVIIHFKQDENGLYYNGRMDKEKAKRQNYSESRARNRAKSNKDIKKISTTYENISNSYEEHMENENEDENINENININNILDLYINTINSNVSSIEYEKLKYYINVFKNDLSIIKYAIEYCKMYKAYNINYLCKILSNWEKSGYKSLKEVKEHENRLKKDSDGSNKKLELFDYNWLDEDGEIDEDEE